MGAAEPFLRESDHTYWIGERRIPGVTSIIDHLTDFSRVPADKLEVARQKGQAVHSMVDMHEKGILDEESLPAWLQPILSRYLKWLRETGFRTIKAEHKVYHSVYCYAGMLDRYGEFVHAAEFGFVDFKRSFLAGEVIGVQLAAYQAAYIDQHRDDKNAKKAKRYALRLHEDGPYRMEPYTDEGQFQDFLTCLAHQRVKEKYQ